MAKGLQRHEQQAQVTLAAPSGSRAGPEQQGRRYTPLDHLPDTTFQRTHRDNAMEYAFPDDPAAITKAHI
jgi:hypothetical protein